MRKTKKRVLIKRVDTMSPKEIKKLREQAISQAKQRAAELFGGSPDDYEVK